jgi:uncharacterized protein (DUF488 family)
VDSLKPASYDSLCLWGFGLVVRLGRPFKGRAGISYQHMARAFEFIKPSWRNASFRGFADYMQTAEFKENLQVLIGLARKEVITLMCAEAVPWRCHRSLVADALMIRGITVEHILSHTNQRTHLLTPWARGARLGHIISKGKAWRWEPL